MKASCSLYMDLVTRQKLEQIAKEHGTSFSGLVSAICNDYIKELKLEPRKQTEKPQRSENPQHQDTISPNDRKFLEEVKNEWNNRDVTWREKQGRYIARIYGPAGEEFLSSLLGRAKP